MRIFLILIVGALLVAGCAIPVPLQIASWAVDGISMLATKKSVADHGLSILAQKDCAVWRGVTAGKLCRNAISGDTMVAGDVVTSPAKSGLTKTVSFGPNLVNSLLSSPNDTSVSATLSTTPHVEIMETRNPITELRVAEYLPIKRITSGMEPAEGIYFVVGSFHNAKNAQRLLGRIAKLAPSVLNANLEGPLVYRVVVGPVTSGREKNLHRALARKKIHDTWAIRVDPSEWRFAEFSKTPTNITQEIATLKK